MDILKKMNVINICKNLLFKQLWLNMYIHINISQNLSVSLYVFEFECIIIVYKKKEINSKILETCHSYKNIVLLTEKKKTRETNSRKKRSHLNYEGDCLMVKTIYKNLFQYFAHHQQQQNSVYIHILLFEFLNFNPCLHYFRFFYRFASQGTRNKNTLQFSLVMCLKTTRVVGLLTKNITQSAAGGNGRQVKKHLFFSLSIQVL